MQGGLSPGPESAADPRRLGLVALGDSITVGEGSMMLGVTPLSWAQWLARALDLPFTSYACNGALAGDVLREQLPRVQADYDVAVLYAGVNDVRGGSFDAEAYERARLAARTDTLAVRLAIAQLPNLGARLLMVFGQIADRWGERASEEDVLVPLALSHGTLADLVCAQRPSVTKALGRLSEEQRLVRRKDGLWLLRGR